MNRIEISSLDYPKFSALLGFNTPPGGTETVEWWIANARITKESKTLDLACCHGFSSFIIANKTNSQVKGIDIDPFCIRRANEEKSLKNFENISFECMNAENLTLNQSDFSHIVSGCSLGFIGDLQKAIEGSHRALKQYGFLCSANFYFKKTPPDDLLKEAGTVLGFPIRTDFQKRLLDSTKNLFTLAKEEEHKLLIHPEDFIKVWVKKFIDDRFANEDNAFKESARERLTYYRTILNELRRYQFYKREIWVAQ